MEELDKKDWDNFLASSSNTLSVEEVKLVSQLHAKYFKHKYNVPCSCNPKTIIRWIDDLNNIYE